MLDRFLSMLGITPRMPSLSTGIDAARNAAGTAGGPDTDGQATFSYAAGTRLPSTQAETGDTQDKRREGITDDDLVWPNKVETIHIRNEEPVAYRFDLSVTDLEAGLYVRRPPVGGAWQPQGGVLLQPNEETTFEVVFMPPADAAKARSRVFNFIITRYDPRRANDPGQVFGELSGRWVPLPTSEDLRLAAEPQMVICRPWRRQAIFALEFLNRSELPPSVQLNVLRGATKEALQNAPVQTEGVEKVGSLAQALPSRTPCAWHCMLPAPAVRGSYYATAAGNARVAESTEYPISLTGPVYVRYVGWLRMGRDWVFLLCTLFLVMLIAWGIPIRKTPTLYVDLNFAGGLPPGGSYNDLQLLVTPTSGGEPLKPSHEHADNKFQITLPERWCGYRPFFGWNGAGRAEQKYLVQFQVPADEKKPIYKDYDLNALNMDTPDATSNIIVSGDHGPTGKKAEQPFFGAWALNTTAKVGHSSAIRLKLSAAPGDMGAAGKADSVQIQATLDGKPAYTGTLTFKDLEEKVLPLDSPPSGSQLLVVQATAVSASDTDLKVAALPISRDNITPQKEPYSIKLIFPKMVLLPPKETSVVAGGQITIPIQGKPDGTKVSINGKLLTIHATPSALVIDVPKETRGKVDIKAKPPSGPEKTIASVEVKPPAPPPPPFEKLAYAALISIQPNIDSDPVIDTSNGQRNDEAQKQASNLPDDNPMKHAIIGFINLRKNNIGADEEFRQAIKLASGQSSKSAHKARAIALVGQGILAEKEKKGDQAEAAYQNALTADPAEFLAYINYAIYLKNVHRIQEATDLLQKGINDGSIPASALSMPLFTYAADKLNVKPH